MKILFNKKYDELVKSVNELQKENKELSKGWQIERGRLADCITLKENVWIARKEILKILLDRKEDKELGKRLIEVDEILCNASEKCTLPSTEWEQLMKYNYDKVWQEVIEERKKNK